MDDSVRWTVKVSPDTDEAVRSYLGRRGRSAHALSRPVEEALRAQVFEKSVERVKGMTAGVGAAKLRGIVDEAVRLAAPRRAVVTIFDEDKAMKFDESTLLSEPALAQDWNRPEEDAAWSHLQPAR